MFKQLLATTLMTLTPHNVVNIFTNNITVNKQDQSMLVDNTSQQHKSYYSYYSYIPNQEWLTVGNTRYKNKQLNVIIYTDNLNGTTHIQACNLSYFRLNSSHGLTAIEDIQPVNSQIPNLQTGNYNYIYSATYLLNEDEGYDPENADTLLFPNQTNAIQVWNQISTNFTNVNNANGWANVIAQGSSNQSLFEQAKQQLKNRILGNINLPAENAQDTVGYQIYTVLETDVANESLTNESFTIYNNTYTNTFQQLNLNFEYEMNQEYPPTEVIDIPGLIFTILGLPFAWIGTAFNLTLFPGTQYAVNLSHIFFAIVLAGALIFIIKRILK